MSDSRSSAQSGMSLVELMIAMLLGLIILLAVSQIFVGNRQTFAVTEASSEVQESGRIALQLLSRSVRNADYWGCLESADAVDSILNTGSDADSPFRFRRGISVVESNGASSSDMLEGSAVLTLSGFSSSRSAPLTGSDLSTDSELVAANGVDFTSIFRGGTDEERDGEILAVSNCEVAEIFKAGEITSNAITVESASSSAMPSNSRGNLINPPRAFRSGRVQQVTGERYFVALQGDGRPALMFQKLNTRGGGDYHAANELVSGIERMAIQLGIDSNGNGTIDSWEDARIETASDALSHADNALGLRVSLLASSRTDQVVDEPMSYCFPAWGNCGEEGADIQTATDRRLYRVYSSSIGIRNRLSD